MQIKMYQLKERLTAASQHAIRCSVTGEVTIDLGIHPLGVLVRGAAKGNGFTQYLVDWHDIEFSQTTCPVTDKIDGLCKQLLGVN